jgi:hypothetical protein
MIATGDFSKKQIASAEVEEMAREKARANFLKKFGYEYKGFVSVFVTRQFVTATIRDGQFVNGREVNVHKASARVAR